MNKLSVVTIAKNEAEHIGAFLKSVEWVDEIIIVDNNSSDQTQKLAKKYTNKVFANDETNLGLLKQFALRKATGNWILKLDVDELVSEELKREIKKTIKSTKFDAFYIPYQNHFMNHALVCKAQQYSKIRLFRKKAGNVKPDIVHEEVEVTGKIGYLHAKILHYSFRNILQVLQKFTYYAKIEQTALNKKGEQLTLKKLVMYPLHMFWAIFIRDEGYKDGIYGVLLAFCFAYYEFARYFFLAIKKLNLY